MVYQLTTMKFPHSINSSFCPMQTIHFTVGISEKIGSNKSIMNDFTEPWMKRISKWYFYIIMIIIRTEHFTCNLRKFKGYLQP